MAKTGFIVFGRPVTHEFVSNGLFKELNLESETYQEFPNEFGNNKSFASITRQQLNDGTQIIKVYLFEYAESLNNRLGGFLGSGIAFRGLPSQKLLDTAYKYIHSQTRTLIDDNRKFKKSTFDENDIKLIDPNTEGLIISEHNSKVEISNEVYGLKIDGPILLHIMSAVQGFMFNPNFKKIKTLYVSESKELLQQYVEPRKVLSFGHLLNYEALHKAQHQKKASLDKELKTLSEELKFVKKNIESENNELKKILNQIEIQKKEVNEWNSKINQAEINYGKYKSEISNQQRILAEIKSEKHNDFQRLITDKRFSEEIESYKNKHTKQVHNLEIELIETREELKKTKTKSNRRTVVGSIVTLFLVTAMFFAGSFYAAKQAQPVIVEKVESKPAEKLKVINPPETIGLSQFLTLDTLKQKEHKKELDLFIEEVEKADESYDLSNFYEREWHFAEIIDYNKESIDKGMERYLKIRNILKKQKETIPLFEMQFLLPTVSEEGFTLKEIDFETNKRNEILKQYLRMDGNAYRLLEFNYGEVSDFEKDLPLLYMHFRWMVYNLSTYIVDDKKTAQADISKTNKTKHTVLIKK